MRVSTHSFRHHLRRAHTVSTAQARLDEGGLRRQRRHGFVVAEGQRGFEVGPVSIQNLRELAQLRILLEHHAMTESFRAGDMEWEGSMVSTHHKLAVTERAILTDRR
jgi:GntR family carbon starvation induced transcriptional regulator